MMGGAHARESAPQLITRTHRLGLTVQEARLEQGLQRDQATAEVLLDAARERDPAAALVQPDMTNGDGILFDGRLWHGSFNGRKRGRRLALLPPVREGHECRAHPRFWSARLAVSIPRRSTSGGHCRFR